MRHQLVIALKTSIIKRQLALLQQELELHTLLQLAILLLLLVEAELLVEIMVEDQQNNQIKESDS